MSHIHAIGNLFIAKTIGDTTQYLPLLLGQRQTLGRDWQILRQGYRGTQVSTLPGTSRLQLQVAIALSRPRCH